MTDRAAIAELSRQAAEAVVGEGVIDQVEVRDSLTASDEPAYEVYYRIDMDRSPLGPGMTLIRLTQHLRDSLLERGDETRPIVRLLNENDWRYFQQHA